MILILAKPILTAYNLGIHYNAKHPRKEDTAMHKIGILSDTHNLLRDPVTDILRTCDAILHCGDIATPQILEQLKAIAPVYAVRGNADGEWAAGLPQSLSIVLYGIKIFMVHNKKMLSGDIRDRNLIVCGHSHKYEELQKNGQIWLNPGSCGRRRFSLPVTMAMLTVPKSGVFQIERISLADETPFSSNASQKDMKAIVNRVMKETDKGKSVENIAKSCRISPELAALICRLYLTHPGVSSDGILQKMGL